MVKTFTNGNVTLEDLRIALDKSGYITRIGLVLLFVLASIIAKAEPAEEKSLSASGALKVATKQAPPFAMLSSDSKWSGLAIELLEEVAQDMGRSISWAEEASTVDLIDAVASGEADIGIAAVTINSQREQAIDFSHSYYATGLSIAVSQNRNSSFTQSLRALVSPAFLTTVGALGLLLLATGALIWIVERRRNSNQFQRDPIEGIGNGVWWAAVTMTTVGYGDKTPVTPLGRAIAIIWMFAALILTAVFTAQLASSLTVERITGPVASVADLSRARVGIVDQSASSKFFKDRFIRTIPFTNVSDGLRALKERHIDAFVHDEPILKFYILRDYVGELDLLPQLFQIQDYGIVLPPGSALRETLNRALLKVLASQRWVDIKQKYLGGTE